MPSNNKNVKVKMSLGEFMGEAPSTDTSALPTAPKQRGPGDDGAFRRHDRRRDDDDDFQMSRGDTDDNWRRGAGGGGGGGGGFGGGGDRGGSYGRGGGYDDRGGDRGGGFGNNRGYDDRGGGGFDRGGDSESGSWRRGTAAPSGAGGGGFDDRGGGGYNRGGTMVGPTPSRFEGRNGTDDLPPSSLGTRGSGERPRLQLKARTAPVSKPQEKKELPSESTTLKPLTEEKKDPVPAAKAEKPAEKTGIETEKENENLPKADDAEKAEEETKDDKNVDGGNKEPSRKMREPKVVNSRAAALEATEVAKRESNNRKEDGERFDKSRGPPPVVNKRFEQMADEERDRQKDREARRGPPPVTNSRFAAVAEADQSYRGREDRMRDDRGPPPVANSRFAAAAEADRTYRDDRGPPPVANSRFAAAAEADRPSYREGFEDRGPPPVANSRFAAAAEADRSQPRDDGFGRDDRGPPAVANSRFAAAAARNEEEDGRFRQERNDMYGRNDGSRGPPVPQNSRFAAAVASDPDYVDREHRERQDDRGDRSRGRDEYDDRGFGGRGGFGGGGDGYGRHGDFQDLPRGPAYGGRYEEPSSREEPKSSVADLLKPKVRPVEENILKVPTKEHADNILKPPTKEHADNVLKPPTKETKETEAEKTVAAPAAPTPAAAVANTTDILDEFVTGKRLGEDLKTWLEGQTALPSVKDLVFHLLTETEKLNPDVECGWAETDKYGAALVSLVHDDLLKQMDVLFGIQKYCDKLGMPKLDEEYVVQSMFRSMYKFDLAEDDAFAMWKEDESPENEAGKLKAVVQTVDWFNWLEEDDDDEVGEEDYEE